MPNNPSIIINQISNAYYLNRCDEADKLAVILSNMRFGTDFSNETKSIYYGSAGINLALCAVNPDLGRKMLETAISLSSVDGDKEIYLSYLDALDE